MRSPTIRHLKGMLQLKNDSPKRRRVEHTDPRNHVACVDDHAGVYNDLYTVAGVLGLSSQFDVDVPWSIPTDVSILDASPCLTERGLRKTEARNRYWSAINSTWKLYMGRVVKPADTRHAWDKRRFVFEHIASDCSNPITISDIAAGLVE
jgi:hypothetical protein